LVTSKHHWNHYFLAVLTVELTDPDCWYFLDHIWWHVDTDSHEVCPFWFSNFENYSFSYLIVIGGDIWTPWKEAFVSLQTFRHNQNDYTTDFGRPATAAAGQYYVIGILNFFWSLPACLSYFWYKSSKILHFIMWWQHYIRVHQ